MAPQSIEEPVTAEEADTTLERGYPSDEDLKRYPLGETLLSIPSVDQRYPRHIRKVFEGVEILLSPQRYKLVNSWQTQPQEAAAFNIICNQIFGTAHTPPLLKLGRHAARFLRLLALYHDIGKSVVIERHPLVGAQLLKEVYRERVHKELYPLLLARDREEWRRELDTTNGKGVALILVMRLGGRGCGVGGG